jgi:hypothetical protein
VAEKKLTRKQIAQLGGFGAARALGSEGMARIGTKGGAATLEARGREHYIRMAHKRWNRLGGPAK